MGEGLFMTMEILITGGAGFIGINFVYFLMGNTDYQITNIDALTYASHPFIKNEFRENDRYRFIQCDITKQQELDKALDRSYDAIINFAAESHVDRSIENAAPFIQTNIIGTMNLLNAVRDGKAKKMIQISTDEVYGTLLPTDEAFTESTPLSPNNPYSASKAAADLLVQSYFNTYQLPVMITRCSNNYGPFQHVEKFIPKIITSALVNKQIPIYGDGEQIRDWLYVEDHCRAIYTVLKNGKAGEVYNIGGGNEKTNFHVVTKIIDYLGADHRLIKYVADRLGHDRRYAINYEKIKRELNWEPQVPFEEGLLKTINWYRDKTRSDDQT